jgi:hypothetical protein
MQLLKIFVGVSNLLLLIAGAAAWIAGTMTKNPSRKRIGAMLLSIWLVYDLIGVILAWYLGWFA